MSRDTLFPAADGALPRRLGPWHAVGLVVGITIGSGIFRTPAVIAERVPDPPLMLAVWLIGGLISLCGALSVAELAAAFPRTGGWYVFVREGWGRLPAFLFGWAELVLIRASATGAIAMVFSSYLLRSLGFDGDTGHLPTRLLAAGTIVLTAAANIRGVRLGAALTGASSVGKFTALALLVAVAFVLGDRHGGSVAHFAQTGTAVDAGRFGLALVSVLWAYDGFADVSFAAGEVRDPQRTLPRAIVGGLLAIIVIYVAANAAYLYVLPIGAVARSPLIASDIMRALAGDAGGTVVSLVVALSTFGSLSGIMLAAPRIFFAMAAEGLFFRAIGAAHPRYQTPHRAILMSAALGVAFVLTRTFEQLADTFVLAIWPFYGVAVAGLYRLRRSRDNELRSYRTPGYPLVPAIFIAGVIYLVGNAVAVDPLWTLATFAIVLAGVPVYYVLFAGRSR
jgi:basic amino acid/polyamine antiporter, APA family